MSRGKTAKGRKGSGASTERGRKTTGSGKGRSRAKASATRGAKKRKRAEGRAPKPARWKVWLKRLFVTGLVLGVLGLCVLAGVFWYYGRDLPDVTTLREYAPPQTTRVLARDGEVLGEVFTERRTVIPIEAIPRSMIVATLAAEDADFYQHEGLDYPGIVRAVLRDLAEGRKAQGASTITQQVVKLLLLTPERTFARKIRELILARRLEPFIVDAEAPEQALPDIADRKLFRGHGVVSIDPARAVEVVGHSIEGVQRFFVSDQLGVVAALTIDGTQG